MIHTQQPISLLARYLNQRDGMPKLISHPSAATGTLAMHRNLAHSQSGRPDHTHHHTTHTYSSARRREGGIFSLLYVVRNRYVHGYVREQNMEPMTGERGALVYWRVSASIIITTAATVVVSRCPLRRWQPHCIMMLSAAGVTPTYRAHLKLGGMNGLLLRLCMTQS